MSQKNRHTLNMEDAVGYFVSVESKQKFKGNDKLIAALECIEKTSITTGLLPEHIVALVDVAAGSLQVETVCKRIIKALIPQSFVPEVAVIKCISWICTRKPSINIQCLLLRWILVIYDHIDSKNDMRALYGVLFHFLHYRTFMPYICHLLYLLTTKEHVKLFRVRFLIQYQKDLGPQPFLTGLLSIYRHYYPRLVHIAQSRSYKSFFPNYDRKWISTVQQVRDNNGLPRNVDFSWEKAYLERLTSSGNNSDLMPSRKRRKIDPIPAIHSLSSKSDYKTDTLRHSLGLQTVPFAWIHSLKCVLDSLDAIEFPSQIGAVLKSDHLKHVMSYTKDYIASMRFQFWISKTLQEELVDSMKQNNKQRVTNLLHCIKQFSDFLQEGIPAVDTEISDYLHNWNGQHYAPLIYSLISRRRIYSFPSFYEDVLEPLRKLFFASSVYTKCKIVTCLTDLLRNHAANEWPRNVDKYDTNSSKCLFSQDMDNVDGVDVIQNLVKFSSELCLTGLLTEKQQLLFEMCVLDFIELVSDMHRQYSLPFVLLVDTRLVERLLISGHTLSVSRICVVLCNYKKNFDSLKSEQKAGRIKVCNSQLETKMIRECNRLVVDVCNTLWRFNQFKSNDDKSLFSYKYAEVDKENMGSAVSSGESLSLFQHTAFLPYSIRFMKENQISTDMENIRELRPMKKDFLNYLDRQQFTGLSKLVSTFVRSAARTSTHSASKTRFEFSGLNETSQAAN